jgi:hypothetical protein
VVVAAGGFVGKGRHDVAIETGSLEVKDGKFYVEGATRENVKATPNSNMRAGCNQIAPPVSGGHA